MWEFSIWEIKFQISKESKIKSTKWNRSGHVFGNKFYFNSYFILYKITNRLDLNILKSKE